MTRPLHTLLFACFVSVVVVACSSTRHVTDGHSPEEQRSIAEACLSMLHSSLTNEMDIAVDDPRVPEVIRSLQPIDIQVVGTDVVITRSGSPFEYHFSRRSSDPKAWVLYVAGHGYDGHEELIRLDHE